MPEIGRVVTGFALAIACTSAVPAHAGAPDVAPAAPSLREQAPQSGVGLMTGGSFMLVGGTALLVTSSFLTARDPDLAPAIVGSAAMMAAGSTFVWMGDRRARRLRAWSSETGLRPPPDGRAAWISGFVVGGGGLIAMLAFGGLSLGYCTDNCFDPNVGAWFGTAGAAVGTGLALITTGAVLRSRHRKWRAGESPQARIMPSFGLGPTRVQVGIAGAF
jgi:hypothetical protein